MAYTQKHTYELMLLLGSPRSGGSHTRRISHDQALCAATSPTEGCCSYTESRSSESLYKCSANTVESEFVLNGHSVVASSRKYKAVQEGSEGSRLTGAIGGSVGGDMCRSRWDREKPATREVV